MSSPWPSSRLHGGLLLTQGQRSAKPLGTALDAMLALIVHEAAA
jgi:hypothetical protein